MTEENDLIGTWKLTQWRALKDDVPHGFPMGENAQGQIIYSAQGRMAAFLMRADYHQNPAGTQALPDTFIAYGGTYRTEGEEVIHDVNFASLPHWIGRPLVRTMVHQGADLLLKTAPEYSKSGACYVHELLWRRIG